MAAPSPAPAVAPPSATAVVEARLPQSNAVVVQTVDEEAAIIGGVKLFVWTQKKSSDQSPGITDTAIHETNASGHAVIAAGSDLASILLRDHDEQFSRLNAGLFFKDVQVSAPFTKEISVVVRRLRTISVRIVYDTGELYSGRAGVSQGESGWSQWHPVESGVLQAELPLAGDANITAYVDRPGYSRVASRVLTASELQTGAMPELVITKNNTGTGSILLDMTSHPDAGLFSYRLSSAWSAGSGFSDTPMPPSRLYTIEVVRAGQHVVSVTVDDLVYSQTVEVTSGAVTTVLVRATKAASARVRIVDSAGEQIVGGVLRLAAPWHSAYPARDRAGVEAVSNNNGIAVLGRLPSSLTSLQVEAEGFDPTIVPVVLTSGVEADLGTVSLVPASGKITVRVINGEDGAAYNVGILQPGGGGNSMGRPLPATGTIEFSSIPCRSYTVFLIRSSGGAAVSQHVTLTKDAPEVEVEIDAAKLNEQAKATFK